MTRETKIPEMNIHAVLARKKARVPTSSEPMTPAASLPATDYSNESSLHRVPAFEDRCNPTQTRMIAIP